MCSNECTKKLNDLIDNLNNESLTKVRTNISDYVISIADKKIDNFYDLLNRKDEHICTNTNEHIFRKHFFLVAIEDVNNDLSKNNAGFLFEVSDEPYDYSEEKIVDHVTPPPKRIYKETLYLISVHKKYMLNTKLLVKLKEPNNDLHVFSLKNIDIM